MKTKILIATLLMATTTVFAHDSKGGGGGDASEARVNEIRADLLSWIEKGGARGLNLPSGISLNDYNEKMTGLLAPKAVEVIFVEKDDSKEEELQVVVDGKPKTCRGFYSRKTNQPSILCSIGRFKETAASEQYKLIHHEYAGLAYLEQNEGATSDYSISNQITDYLSPTTVLRLTVARVKETGAKPPFSLSRGIFSLQKTLFLDELLNFQGDKLLIDQTDGEQGIYKCIIRPEGSLSYKLPAGDYKILPTSVYYKSYIMNAAGFLHATLVGQGVSYYLKCMSDKQVGSRSVECGETETRIVDGRIERNYVSRTCSSATYQAPEDSLELKTIFQNMFTVSEE